MKPSSLWTPLHAHFQQTLQQRQFLSPHQSILVAVSGGQDSLCLLKLLLDLQPKWHWQLGVIHCDHQWRSDSGANADYIQQLAQTWHLPYHLSRAHTPPATEAAAREWRYQTFTHIAQTHDYDTVVTGHTASDQAETLLYNLIRGSGADGLQSLAWHRLLSVGPPPVALIRPILNITRTQTADFCQTQGLQVWEDTTNQDLTLARNRIRQELLPYLQTHFNPQVETALTQTAELLRADVHYLEETASEWRQQAQGMIPEQINRQRLKTIPLAIRRRVIRQWLQECLPTPPTFAHIEKITQLISAPNRSQTDPLPGGKIAQVRDSWIILSTPSS